MSLKISLLLDGQLAPDEAREAIEAAATESRLRDRYTSYALVGDALRGNSTPDDGFSTRILDRLRRDGAKIEKDFDPMQES